MTGKDGFADWMQAIPPDSDWLSPPYRADDPPFDQVEIQAVSWCNRSCDFCPSGTFPVDKTFISAATIERIITQLVPLEFAGTIGLHLMCEPLLHKRLEEIVKEFRSRLPKVFIRIESNGDALDKNFDRLIGLCDSGLNEILINCYDGTEQFEFRNRRILDLVRRNPDLWYRNRWLAFPEGPRKNWRVVGMRALSPAFSLRNWAGHVGTQSPHRIDFPLPLSCARPFRRIHVNVKGEAVLCNCDWKSQVVAGDLGTQSIGEVWNAPVMKQYRRRLLNRDRDMPLCRTCDAGVPMEGFLHPPADRMAPLRNRLLVLRRKVRSLKLAVLRRLTA